MVGKGPTPGPIGRDGRAQAPSCNQRPNSPRSRPLAPSLAVGFAASCEAPGAAAPPEGISIAVDLLRTRTRPPGWRSEEHTSELQSLMRNSYAVFCLITNKQKHIKQ